jgi:glycosyltransferase involved in cell wall biosynthesis
MIISLYSTQIIDTPPKMYGGLELECYLLARYLSENGHQVYLFATNDSYQPPTGHLFVAGKAGTVHPVSAWKGYWDFQESREALKNSDIVCSMDWDYAPYSVAHELKHLCHVHHGPTIGFAKKPPLEKSNLIAVSFNHAKNLMKQNPAIEWRAVQNGIDLEKYPFKKEKGDYLLWVGRIFPPKGPDRFINICDKIQMKGIMCGGSFGDDANYKQFVKDKLAKSKFVTYVGDVGSEIPHEKKVELYQNAKAVIQPSVEEFPGGQFIEPFGLISIESYSCGTPVVVCPSGGWNETTIHGKTGFFANTDDEFCYFIKHIDEIKPEDCRAHAEHFSYKRTGAEFVKIFEEILAGRNW